MIRNKAKKIAAFAIAAMMAAAITPAIAAPSFASEENTEATTTDAEVMIEEAEENIVEEAAAEEEIAEEENIEAEVSEEKTEEEVAGEAQQEDMVCAKGVVRAMASTTPSQAQTLSFGQKVSGRFTGSLQYTVVGNRYYMERVIHYYKFRTGNTTGASYVVKVDYSRYGGDSPNDIEKVALYDRNYNLVEFSSVSPAERAWRSNYGQCNESMYLREYEAGSLTYKSLKPNQDYYIAVQCEAGPYCSYIDYRVGVETNGSAPSTPSTPSLRTPKLTVDKTKISATDANSVYVTGRVSYACGQHVAVYDADGRVAYNYVTLGNSKRSETFSIKIYSRYLNKGINHFKVRSLPVRNYVNCSNAVDLTVEIGQTHSTWYPIYKTTVNGSVYEILQNKEIGGPSARLVKAKNAKSMTIPAMISYKGVKYYVKGIQPNAFKGSKVKTVTIKTRMLSKASVKNCLQGSKVKTIKVKTVNKKLSKSFVKKYKKFFTKGNCGKKVKVK